MGLRQDWRHQLTKAHRELGFQYVRFHGLLDDAMSVVSRGGWGSGPERLSFFNIDSIFDFLLSIGMKPFIELGFMPSALASGAQTCFYYRANVTPPADYEAWGGLIESLARHLVDRYGLDEVRAWFFEVWNEPNLPFFWARRRTTTSGCTERRPGGQARRPAARAAGHTPSTPGSRT
jgi:xylan 1,4-beta-xylosidase